MTLSGTLEEDDSSPHLQVGRKVIRVSRVPYSLPGTGDSDSVASPASRYLSAAGPVSCNMVPTESLFCFEASKEQTQL